MAILKISDIIMYNYMYYKCRRVYICAIDFSKLRRKCKLNAQKNTPNPSNKRSQKTEIPAKFAVRDKHKKCNKCIGMNLEKMVYLIVCSG